MSVNIEYRDKLTTSQVITTISQIPSPHVIMWYIGSHGLKKEGVKYYKDFLINPIIERANHPSFDLLDLTAWAALGDSKIPITKVSSFAEKIDTFATINLRCIKSADIFKKMQKLEDRELIDYFRAALSREFIRKSSEAMPDRNIKLGMVLDHNCAVLSDWFNIDTSKGYSVLQYLEGCLLIEEVVQNCLRFQNNNDIELIFALPNDELKYYRDETNAFKQDVEFLLKHRMGSILKGSRINIKFLAFQYGDSAHQRPYNAPGAVFKRNELQLSDVVTIQQSKEEKE